MCKTALYCVVFMLHHRGFYWTVPWPLISYDMKVNIEMYSLTWHQKCKKEKKLLCILSYIGGIKSTCTCKSLSLCHTHTCTFRNMKIKSTFTCWLWFSLLTWKLYGEIPLLLPTCIWILFTKHLKYMIVCHRKILFSWHQVLWKCFTLQTFVTLN